MTLKTKPDKSSLSLGCISVSDELFSSSMMKFGFCLVLLSVLSGWCGGEVRDPTKVPLSREVSDAIRSNIWNVQTKSSSRMVVGRSSGPTVRVSTKMGDVDGSIRETCRNRQKYAAFFGMRYGSPPIGSRRFRAPVPAEPWDGVYDATFERPSCMQFNGPVSEESEDCLYINVYTPVLTGASKPKAVMVYIHGGAFISGSSNFTVFAPDLFIENDVILVTFNYRLGALGFLSLQTSDIPGNAGLKDQRLALEWVRDNINSFGGDPNLVTIFGESAGSASVSYHILSNASKGLFQRAIMESGTATSPWAFTPAEDTVRIATTLAKKLGCPVTGQPMVDCLRKISAYRITEEQEKTLTLADILTFRPFAFVPTREPDVEGAFLTQNPVDILVAKTFNPVPVIIGFNSREGLLLLPTLKTLDPLNIAINFFSYNLCSLFPTQAKATLSDSEKNYLNTALRKFYSGVKPVGSFNPVKMVDIITDAAFMVPIQYFAMALANSSEPVYNYVFTYDGEYNYFKTGLKIKEKGVCHGDELGYIFYDESFRWNVHEPRYAEAERVANTVMSLWTNFARTGNPTPSGSAVIWPARTSNNVVYADLANELKVTPELSLGLDERYKFWASLIREILTR